MEKRTLITSFALLVTVATAVCGIVAVATNAWKLDKSSHIEYGLFESCQEDPNTNVTTCWKAKSVLPATNAVRAFVIMGDILVVIAIPLTIYHALEKFKAGNIIITAVLAVSGLFLLIGCTIYTWYSVDESPPSELCFGYSFGLAWASGPMALIAALFAFLTYDSTHQSTP